MRNICLIMFLGLFPVMSNANDNDSDEALAACTEAFKSLIKADDSYSKMQRVSCNAREHSKFYWVCVKTKVDAGEDPKLIPQQCPEK